MYTSPLKKTTPAACKAPEPGEKNGRTLPAVPVLQNKPVQKMEIKEEPLQGKFVVQRQEDGRLPEEDKLEAGATQLKSAEEEELLQGKFTSAESASEQQITTQLFTPENLTGQKKENKTGLPDNLKEGVENLSSIAMDDVRVHYNSDKPAQLNALAYAQGTDIHVGPGQEKHLPHEAWHVVQQKQGRVQPTMQMKEGVAVNDDRGLENEADVMGHVALSSSTQLKRIRNETLGTVQRSNASVVQRAGHAEDLCILQDWIIKRADTVEITQYTNHEVPAQAPNFRGPFYTENALLADLGFLGVVLTAPQQQKVHTMAGDVIAGGKGFLLLANATAGMVAPAMRDLKLGKHSASGTDQERHGITGISKTFKILRHDAMDYFSGSSERGFRDEDKWKDDKTGDNLSELNAMLGNAGPQALLSIRNDLRDMWLWAEASNVVYVGMSVLVVVDPLPQNAGKAVAIDFEHPIRNTDQSFETHKAGLLAGIMNIKNIVVGYM